MYQGKRHRGNFEVVKKFLNKNIDLLKNKNILEIGCGTGQLIKWLENSEINASVTGIDLSKEMIERAKNETQESDLLVMDGQKLKFQNETFDVVVSFDVLEHLPNVDEHIKEVRRVLEPNGYYFLGTPNKLINLPFTIIKNKSFTKHKKSHCSLQTYWSLKKLFIAHGFHVELTKMNTKTDFLLKKAKKTLGGVAEILKFINFEKLPLFLQTNFYVKAELKIA